MSVKIYDITTDETREATQADIDRLQDILQISGKMVRVLRYLRPGLVPESGPDFNLRLDDALIRFIQETGLQS